MVPRISYSKLAAPRLLVTHWEDNVKTGWQCVSILGLDESLELETCYSIWVICSTSFAESVQRAPSLRYPLLLNNDDNQFHFLNWDWRSLGLAKWYSNFQAWSFLCEISPVHAGWVSFCAAISMIYRWNSEATGKSLLSLQFDKSKKSSESNIRTCTYFL